MINNVKRNIQLKWMSFKNKVLPRYCYKSARLSSLYYGLIDKSFRREHQAVLAGKIKHVDEQRKSGGNYFLLVRNTHRIEKGLLMRPRRKVFGKDYILETVKSFESIWDPNVANTNTQMKWFYDVLSDYFKTVEHENEIEKAYKIFIKSTKNKSIQGDEKSIPYIRLNEDRSQISYDEFFKLSRQRRSVRWYKSKQVPRNAIDKAILAANESPSACNRQPFEFRVFDDPQLLKELIDYPMGTRGYAHNIPAMIVIVGNLDAYFDERDRHLIYIDASLASMSLMLALETLGLSSCPINWPDIEEREQKMDKFLQLKPHQRSIMCLSVGYPDDVGKVAFSAKKPLELIRKYN